MAKKKKSVKIENDGLITGAGENYLSDLKNNQYKYQGNALPHISNPSLSKEETGFAESSSFMSASKRR